MNEHDVATIGSARLILLVARRVWRLESCHHLSQGQKMLSEINQSAINYYMFYQCPKTLEVDSPLGARPPQAATTTPYSRSVSPHLRIDRLLRECLCLCLASPTSDVLQINLRLVENDDLLVLDGVLRVSQVEVSLQSLVIRQSLRLLPSSLAYREASEDDRHQSKDEAGEVHRPLDGVLVG